jgi:hypothetical protein
MDEPASSSETFSKNAVCLNVDAALLCKWLWIAAGMIIGLGIMREIIISMIGTETVLKDLRHFALDAERSLQSWYESLTMAAASMLLAVIALIAYRVDRVNRIAWTLLAAGGIFVGGALGTELLCGYLATTVGLESIQYKVTAASQECLETIGMTLFVTTLLSHIARSGSSVKLHTTRAVG